MGVQLGDWEYGVVKRVDTALAESAVVVCRYQMGKPYDIENIETFLQYFGDREAGLEALGITEADLADWCQDIASMPGVEIQLVTRPRR